MTTGHERDVETGLDYRGARFYDSDVCRFLSLDPLAAEFPEWSDYNYVLGNPVMFVDPDGKAPTDDYFDENGNYLYTDTKTSEDVRIIKKVDFNKIKTKYGDVVLNDKEVSNLKLIKDLTNKSSLLSELNIRPSYLGDSGDLLDVAAINIMNHYVEEAGFSLNDLKNKTSIALKSADIGSIGYDVKTDKFLLKFNKASFGKELQNRSDFINFNVHEIGGHGPDWRKYKTYDRQKDFWTWETKAVNHQIRHVSWSKTSRDWKQHLFKVYGKHVLSTKDQQKYFGKYGIK